jgi:hypothetical protein
VLLSEVETEVALTIIRQPRSRVAPVDLHLELLASPLPSHLRQQGSALGPPQPPSNPVSVLGHVALEGDVVAANGEWLGGPEFPARIEGIEIRWPAMPNDVDLEYSVVIGGNVLRKLPPRRINEFAGTRGRAAPIVRLAIALRGEAATGYRINVDCLFLGGQMISRSGQKLTLSGPTGREPLVGLRLWIEATPDGNSSDASSSVPRGGLRVFRTSTPMQRNDR